MKSGKTLTELATHVDTMRLQMRDYRVAQNVLAMDADLNLGTPSAPGLLIKPNETMHAQMADRLGVPAKYYNRMRAEAPELLRTNVNEWLSRGQDKKFLRTYADQADSGVLTGRAFLSNGYRPLDNYDLMTALVPPMLSAGVQVVSSEVTEQKLYIQAIAQEFEAKIYSPNTHQRIDDILKIGLIASNSEVGGGSLTIRALVWRKVCTNGLIITDDLPGFKQVHIGRVDSDVNADVLSTTTKRLTDAAIWSKANDVIKAAISQATLDKIAQRLNAIAGVNLQNPEKAVELVAEKFDLIEDERAAVMRNLIAGGDVSQWGLTNAVTGLANDAVSYDRAVELETIGGKVAAMTPNQFGNN